MSSEPIKKRILVSGFEPFDGDAENPSALLLDWLKTNQNEKLHFDLHTALLPVTFKTSYQELKKAIVEFKPTHVVLTGFAKNRSELTLERIAINWVDARIPDNDGVVLKAQKINDDSLDGLFTTLPIQKMLEASLGAGCPTKISTSAGEYVCNHLIYQFLDDQKGIPGTFIHIPGAHERLSYDLFFSGVQAILNSL